MLDGEKIALRAVRDDDLETFHRYRTDIETRGPWMPLPRTSFSALKADYGQHGWWSNDEGVFMIVDRDDRLLGYVAWEALKGTIPDVELGYGIFDRAEMGKGIMTEAIDLLVRYLFDVYQMNRLILCIHPDNVASIRVAAKAGFTKEATARESWYHRGEWQDLELHSITRAENARRPALGSAAR